MGVTQGKFLINYFENKYIIEMQICRQKVFDRHLPMHILDAEYQFDRRKLTFYFEADGYKYYEFFY